MPTARNRLRSKRRPACLTAALLCAVLAISGCGTHANGGSGSGSKGTKALATAYMAIALPANHRLDKEVDSYNDHVRHNLTLAVADLRAQAATERWFDARLLKIAFPPDIAATARALVRANDQRIALTDEQARART